MQIYDLIIAEVRTLLNKYDKLPTIQGDYETYKSDKVTEIRLRSALERLAHPQSVYVKESSARDLDTLANIAKAFLEDLEDGYLHRYSELIHADVFSNMLEAAEHLLECFHHGPAAVVVGCVLEEHLRQLSVKNGIPISTSDGKHVKAEMLNQDLCKGDVYNNVQQKQITTWLGIRNSGAHGKWDEIDKAQVRSMLTGLTDFIAKYPA